MKREDNSKTPVPQCGTGVSMQWELLRQQAQAAYDEGVALRRQASFGEAMNAFARAAELSAQALSALPGEEDAAPLSALHDSALASIDLISEINGFVNTDLMNP